MKSSPLASGLDAAEILARLARELGRLEAAKLDPAVRARAVARLCAVALAALRQLVPEPPDPFAEVAVAYDLSQLTPRQLTSLQRLLEAARPGAADE